MAEQEVIKHTKKAIKVWKDDGHSFWHKFKETLLEIFIIVFAVSLSIWFHNWSEHRKEQQQAKLFLLGLRNDIQADIEDVGAIEASYHTYDTVYRFLSAMKPNIRPDKDSLHQCVTMIYSNIYLIPHKSRFDGFMSSGKILTIESDSLVSNILVYYQQSIPSIKASEGGWLSTQNQLHNYIIENIQDSEDDYQYWPLLTTPRGHYLCKHLVPWPQIYDRYDGFRELGKKIIKQIDEEYPQK